jgi:glycosyltransferase involved in cell wall biosynthesis
MRVCIEGHNSRVAGMLAELDIFVLSSTSEGLPLAILEAMAAGPPIVSTRVGGVSEVTPEGDVSILCAPGSASQLEDAMYQAATAGHLPRMGKRAREIAFAKFSLDQMWSSYQTIYAEATHS